MQPRLAIAAVLLLAAAASVVVRTAASDVPETKLADVSQPVTAAALAPPACRGMLFTGVTYGDGDLAAIELNRLFLGGPDTQHIFGTAGPDCIVGGAGDDILDGGGGNDVCIGSATATFSSCELALTW